MKRILLLVLGCFAISCGGMPLDMSNDPVFRRRLLQTCTAGEYASSGTCHNCPNNSISAVGSLSYSSCICTAPQYLQAYNIIAGTSGYLGPSTNYGTNAVHIITNPLPSQAVTLTSWTVTTTGPCTITPFFTFPSNNYQWSPDGQANFYLNGYSTTVNIPSAGTYTFPWSGSGPNTQFTANGYVAMGFYIPTTNCISQSSTGSQYITTFAPGSPNFWSSDTNWYLSYSAIFAGTIALQFNSAPSSVPTVMACSYCPANTYWASNTNCANCPTNSHSPIGSSGLSSCVCTTNMILQGSACVCIATY